MEQLWAPWRMQYISKADEVEGCIFCVFPAERNDEERAILQSTPTFAEQKAS